VSEKVGSNFPPYDPDIIVDLERLAAQLRDTYGHLFKEMDTLVSAANNWVLRHQKIENDEEQGLATEQVAQLLTALDAYHGKPGSIHTVAKEPFLKGGRIVDAVLNVELAGPVRAAIEDLKKPMKAYAEAKAKWKREAEQAEMDRRANEAFEQARNFASAGDMQAAMQADQDALDTLALGAQASISKASQTRGDLGGLSNLRGKWKARVVNICLVPREFMMADLSLIEFKMNQSKDKKTGAPAIEIKGVEFFQETSLSIRR
jgi:hypothetical protein